MLGAAWIASRNPLHSGSAAHNCLHESIVKQVDASQPPGTADRQARGPSMSDEATGVALAASPFVSLEKQICVLFTGVQPAGFKLLLCPKRIQWILHLAKSAA